MDYSHAAFFANPQPYQFMGITPLTPSHSNSAASDEFTTTSPPEVYEQYPPNALPHDSHHQFPASYDNFAQFGHHQQFPGPPTPPNVHSGGPQQTPPHVLGGGSGLHHHSNGSNELLAVAKVELTEEQVQARRQGSNSEEDELTPAQSRRKAQNRAAQRAFRERKERHVKDLEAKLASLEAAQAHTASENERLKRDLQKVSTENEILRATSTAPGGSPGPSGSAGITTGPMEYNPTDFYTNVLQNHDNKSPSHRIVQSETGERLLAAGATWELIIQHDLFRKGLVDIGDVSERLKHQAKCDGQGPVFEERVILEAIRESVASGSDELL